MSSKKNYSEENPMEKEDVRLRVLDYNDGECVLSPLPRRVALVAVAVAIVSQVLITTHY